MPSLELSFQCSNADKTSRESLRSFQISATTDDSASTQSEVLIPIGQIDELERALRTARYSPQGKEEPQSADVMQLGMVLFDSIFQDEVRDLFFLTYGRAEASEETLRLYFKFSSKTPILATLSWEYLYWKTRGVFLCQTKNCSIIRSLDLPVERGSLHKELPLRVLFISASPNGTPVATVEGHERAIVSAFRDLRRHGHIEFLSQERTNKSQLIKVLEGRSMDVLHVLAHGTFDPLTAQGSLILQDAIGREVPVSDRSLASLIAQCSPRLVVLCSCHSAEASDRDVFAGLAQQLIASGTPAVIAMRLPIRECDAEDLTQVLYAALARGSSIDQAVTDARVRIQLSHPTAWGIPALFLRTLDDKLFEPPKYFGHPLARPLLELEAAMGIDSATAVRLVSKFPLEKTNFGRAGNELWEIRDRLRDVQNPLDNFELIRLLERFVAILGEAEGEKV